MKFVNKDEIVADALEDIKQVIREHVRQDNDGNERCGIVFFDKELEEYRIREVKNISQNPRATYKMSPVDLGQASEGTDLFVNKAKNRFIGFWHTHPMSLHNPSYIDLDTFIVGRKYFIYCMPEDRMTVWEKIGDC